jgi:ribonucleoside-diphosphate reductase alpha chain
MDWDTLRADIAQYGIRNATTMALMPAETSAQISNSTNGIEPPRSIVSIKASKDGILKQVVPEIGKLKNKYTLLWDMKDNDGYLKIVAVLQKYIDQSISANTSYNPANYKDNKLSMKLLLKELTTAYKYGVKNLYYMNTNDGAGEVDVSGEDTVKEKTLILPELPGMTLDDEDSCDSCTI